MKGSIYKISSQSCEKFYIGSTMKTVEERFDSHKKYFEKYKKKESRFVSSYILMGYDDVKIELIESKEIKSVSELREMEGRYIRMHKDQVVNKKREALTQEEKKEYQRNYHAIYRQKRIINKYQDRGESLEELEAQLESFE